MRFDEVDILTHFACLHEWLTGPQLVHRLSATQYWS
jgi:hypothetical protein